MSPNNASPNNANGEPTPLEADQLDELLSAALDGEFDAAAREFGWTADEARARIRSTPGAETRRAALETARTLLSETPEMDELLASRLRAKAVRAAEAEQVAQAHERKRRRNRIALSTCGIAAAIAAVVAVAAGINGFHPDSYSSSSKSASSPTSIEKRQLAPGPTKPTATGSTAAGIAVLGPFPDAHALAVAAVENEAAARAAAQDPLNSEVAPVLGADYGQSETAGRTTADDRLQFDSTTKAAAKCAAPPEVPTGSTPVLRASATLAGKPVVVLVFANADEHIVVIENPDCTLVNLQMLR